MLKEIANSVGKDGLKISKAVIIAGAKSVATTAAFSAAVVLVKHGVSGVTGLSLDDLLEGVKLNAKG